MRDISEWSREAICRDAETREIIESNPRRAKKICLSCPVVAECLEYSLIYKEHGVWGGMTHIERIRMLRNNPTLQQLLTTEAKLLRLFEKRYSIAEDYWAAQRAAEQSA